MSFCVNDSYRLLFNFGEARIILLLSALNIISNANSAVAQNILFISDLNGRVPMIVGHCWAMRDHGTETKNNFDCVAHSLKQIEKDYHRAKGCDLSPYFLLRKLKAIKENVAYGRNS